MPTPPLAARIRTAILERPDQHDQNAYLDGVDVLHPQDDLTGPTHCGTTLCVAGYAAHLTGHTLLRSGYTYLPGTNKPTPTAAVARRELGLSEHDANWLFHPVRPRAEVLVALDQLAQGNNSINIDAITSHGN